MARRLTLSTAGIKSPLDLADERPPTQDQPEPTEPPQPRAARQRQPRRHRAPAVAPPSHTPPPDARFYGTGRPLQTSIALDQDCAARLDEFAHATGVSTNALAVAALHAGLPADNDRACALIVNERVNRAGVRDARIEHNFRLREHLRARLDQLTGAAKNRLPRATRTDLINAALRTGLPESAEQAIELNTAHARLVEQAAVIW